MCPACISGSSTRLDSHTDSDENSFTTAGSSPPSAALQVVCKRQWDNRYRAVMGKEASCGIELVYDGKLKFTLDIPEKKMDPARAASPWESCCYPCQTCCQTAVAAKPCPKLAANLLPLFLPSLQPDPWLDEPGFSADCDMQKGTTDGHFVCAMALLCKPHAVMVLPLEVREMSFWRCSFWGGGGGHRRAQPTTV